MPKPDISKFRAEKIGRDNLGVFSTSAGFNDIGEQMYFPSLPYYVTHHLNLTAGEYGLIEGIAEAVNRILRVFTGVLSDRWGRKIPIVLGYIFIAFSRLGLPLVTEWFGLMSFRALRQVGRAFRDPAREASITESISSEKRGKAFGILNTVDNIGAFIGPILGWLILSFTMQQLSLNPNNSPSSVAYKWLFIWAAIPTVLSCWIIFLFLKETRAKKLLPSETGMRLYFQQLFNNLRSYFSEKLLFRVTLAYIILGLSMVPFSMILLYAYTNLGATDTQGRILFIVYSIVVMICAYPAGVAVDHFGRLQTQIFACILAVIALGLMVIAPHPLFLLIPVILYGVFEALWIVAQRALIGDLAPSYMTAQVFGTFSMLYGVSVVLCPILLGFFWETFGPKMAFILMAAICGVSLVIFYRLRKSG